MEPREVLAADQIDFSDLEFWSRPVEEREGAFAALRTTEPAFVESWEKLGDVDVPPLGARGLRVRAWDPAGLSLVRRTDVTQALAAMHEAFIAMWVDADTVTLATASIPEQPDQLQRLLDAAHAVAEPLARGLGEAPAYR